MASPKLTPRDRERLEAIAVFERKVQQAHGLVERFAADLGSPERHTAALRRLFSQLKLQFSGSGLDALGQNCGALEVVARRGASRVMKIRILREGVASLKKGLELEARAIRASAQREARREKEANGDENDAA